MGKVYIGTLYRLGYELTVCAKKKKDVVQFLMDEYEKLFVEKYGFDPRSQAYGRRFEKKYDIGTSWYDAAKEDIEISATELEISASELGKVEKIELQ